jgi:hypothetical protein
MTDLSDYEGPLFYCGRWGDKNVKIPITEEDVDMISEIHAALAGESDSAISAAIQLYLLKSRPELLN